MVSACLCATGSEAGGAPCDEVSPVCTMNGRIGYSAISVQPAGEVGAGSQPVSQLSGRSQHQPVRSVTPRPNAFIQKVTIRSCRDELLFGVGA